MRRQRNMLQMKEQGEKKKKKTSEKELNETDK